MDIAAKISEIVEKIKSTPTLLADFTKDPVKAIEGILGTDLPDEQINAIIDGVKEKISLENLGGIGDTVKSVLGGAEDSAESVTDKLKDGLSGIGEKLGGLFKKD